MLNPAKSLTKYLPFFDLNNLKVVLDYGSGNLRNSIFMHRKGYEVYAVDLPNSYKIKCLPRLTCILPEELPQLRLNIDLTLCTFVFNLITDTQRVNMLNNVIPKMVPGGYFLIETKGLSIAALDALLIPRGFARIHNHPGRYTVVALYKFMEPHN